MTANEIKRILKQTDLPVAYYQFEKNTGQQPPFICYFFDGGEDLYADDCNYLKIERLHVELYTDRKDFDLEARVEKLLNGSGMTYSKEEEFIDSEDMHVTVYTTTINLEV